MKKQVTALNELRNRVNNVSTKAGSLNQAWKALNGAMTEAEMEALGLQSMAFKSLAEAWSADLKKTVDGKSVLCLYLAKTVTVKVADGKGGTKDINMYERVETKKGITFKGIKRLELDQPKAWTPALIVEALCQSRFPALAKQESVDTFTHAADCAKDGNMYMKQTVKANDGSMQVTFARLEKTEA